MNKKCFQKLIVSPVVLCLLIFMISSAGLCFGDWDEGDGHKMHYPQLPDLSPNGMDVLAGPLSVPDGMPPYEVFLADDFMCSQSGAITSIHIWGSYNEDIPLHEMMSWPFFSLVIYSDIPADPAIPGSYSMPGEPLWDIYMPATAIRQYAAGPESFYDPIINQIIGMDTMCWQYNFEIPEDMAFVQEEGRIYWLGIHYSSDLNGDGIVNLMDMNMFTSAWPGMFGWKTSGVAHFNDDAVFTDVMTFVSGNPHTVPIGPWLEMRYPVGHEMEQQSIDLAFVINGEDAPPRDTDFGDAPDSYLTKLPGGASHMLGGPWLGINAPDPEPDGQPSVMADGDDFDMAVNDEDGVVIAPMLFLGQADTITITVNGGGGDVAGWIDWDQSGTFDAGEQVIGGAYATGTYPVTVTPPVGAALGQTYARFRITSILAAPPFSPAGQLSDGEVEDYLVHIEEPPPEELDFGDAPSPYPTLLVNDGARHILGGPWLGDPSDNPDPDPDGQPDSNAMGDDSDGNDDEDGIQIPVMAYNTTSTVTVTVNDMAAGAGGIVEIWVDWNNNNAWDHPSEQIFAGPMGVGVNPFNVTPPVGFTGQTCLRARISTQGGLLPTGEARDGEVEDHLIYVEEPFEVKWEQLPDLQWGGVHAHDDAGGIKIIVADDWKCQGGVVTDFHWWGSVEDPGEGQEGFHLSIHANDPDKCLPIDPAIWERDIPISDITVTPILGGALFRYDYYLKPDEYFYQIPGQTYWFDVSSISLDSNNPFVWVWSEHNRSTTPILCPAADKVLPIPPNHDWRTITWGQDPVEYSDMAFRVTSDSSIPSLDFGDAPDAVGAAGYPTLLAHNGARHIIGGPWLGDDTDVPDVEGNGQPQGGADGDDNMDGNDDEDGVVIPMLYPGVPAVITFEVNGGGGVVEAWIDWDMNNAWDPSEQIHNGLLPDGLHSIMVAPPSSVAVGLTYARFRISTAGGLGPDDLADDGEVEDYKVVIETGPQADLGDAPDSTNSNGVAMTSYADGTLAKFPTVFSAGSPPHGPKHLNPISAVWLGSGVTLEDEADIGPDQDGKNNIDPSVDIANQDVADDGLMLPVNMPKCRWTNVDYQVNAPVMSGACYVNIWCDFNRDGDWDDQVAGCSMGDVPEWAVRNQMLVGLPVGLNTVRSLPFVSWHPIDKSKEMWVRITISEQIWQEAWGAGGCGPVNGYDIGETEDYLVIPDTSCVACADLNCDNIVNLPDLAIMATQWLSTCP